MIRLVAGLALGLMFAVGVSAAVAGSVRDGRGPGGDLRAGYKGGPITQDTSVGDDIQIQYGADPNYWRVYNNTGTQLELWHTDCDGGGGADCVVLGHIDGTDNVFMQDTGRLIFDGPTGDEYIYSTGGTLVFVGGGNTVAQFGTAVTIYRSFKYNGASLFWGNTVDQTAIGSACTDGHSQGVNDACTGGTWQVDGVSWFDGEVTFGGDLLSAGDLTINPTDSLNVTLTAADADAFTANDGTTDYYNIDTLRDTSGTHAHSFDTSNPSFANIPTASFTLGRFIGYTLNVTGDADDITGSFSTQLHLERTTLSSATASTNYTGIVSALRIRGPAAGTNVILDNMAMIHIEDGGGQAGTEAIQHGIFFDTLTVGTTDYAITIGSTDAAQNLIHVGVTGDPIISWDETNDRFGFNNDVDVSSFDVDAGIGFDLASDGADDLTISAFGTDGVDFDSPAQIQLSPVTGVVMDLTDDGTADLICTESGTDGVDFATTTGPFVIDVGDDGDDFTVSSTGVTIAGFVNHSTTAGITASTTQTQGQGALTSTVNQISVSATDGDTVTLPSAGSGRIVEIINDGAKDISVFPASGDDASAGVDVAVTIEHGERETFVAYDGTTWAITARTGSVHGEMFDNQNGDAYGVAVATNKHCYQSNGVAAGDLNGIAFDKGTAALITISTITDGGSGQIAVNTAAAHGLSVNDIVSQENLTNGDYEGIFIVDEITDSDTYEVTATFAADDSGTANQCATLSPNVGSGGDFHVSWHVSATSATNNETFDFFLYVGETRQTKGEVRDKFGTAGDYDSSTGGGIIDIDDLQKLSFVLANNDTAGDITIRNFAVVIERL